MPENMPNPFGGEDFDLMGLMGALFSSDLSTVMSMATQAGEELGRAAFEAHKDEYQKLVRDEIQPVKDAILLLAPTIDKVGEILGKLEAGEIGGIFGKMASKALRED